MKPEILIIDDEEVVLMLIKRLVVKTGLHNTPQLFTNGMEAITFIHEYNTKNQPFLVFLDINMPAFDGWEFLDMLNNTPLENQVNVIIITSSVNQSDKAKSKEFSEVIGYIEKPVTEEMMKEVRKIETIAPYFQ
ncbi:MAG: response regulator [Mongoliibacter sp.]|jgi:CheY-like chemotaxis protein|uniref:response regulator n=1 Tax=Mongoliibacter sp. TaxID=2022438 RepID=UPI0012F2FB51|nr:response regulator [Mongoliibacter sp.]TVP51548.1 MAG: response regulator [Mongoliibacter sp.]